MFLSGSYLAFLKCLSNKPLFFDSSSLKSLFVTNETGGGVARARLAALLASAGSVVPRRVGRRLRPRNLCLPDAVTPGMGTPQGLQFSEPQRWWARGSGAGAAVPPGPRADWTSLSLCFHCGELVGPAHQPAAAQTLSAVQSQDSREVTRARTASAKIIKFRVVCRQEGSLKLGWLPEGSKVTKAGPGGSHSA